MEYYSLSVSSAKITVSLEKEVRKNQIKKIKKEQEGLKKTRDFYWIRKLNEKLKKKF